MHAIIVFAWILNFEMLSLAFRWACFFSLCAHAEGERQSEPEMTTQGTHRMDERERKPGKREAEFSCDRAKK